MIWKYPCEQGHGLTAMHVSIWGREGLFWAQSKPDRGVLLLRKDFSYPVDWIPGGAHLFTTKSMPRV